jgi:hypothetical protein
MVAQALTSNYEESEWGPDSEQNMDVTRWKHTESQTASSAP